MHACLGPRSGSALGSGRLADFSGWGEGKRRMGLALALALGSGRETGAVGEAVPGAPSSPNCALQWWNLKGQP